MLEESIEARVALLRNESALAMEASITQNQAFHEAEARGKASEALALMRILSELTQYTNTDQMMFRIAQNHTP